MPCKKACKVCKNVPLVNKKINYQEMCLLGVLYKTIRLFQFLGFVSKQLTVVKVYKIHTNLTFRVKIKYDFNSFKKLKIIYFTYRLFWPKSQKINIYKERAPNILLIFQTKI